MSSYLGEGGIDFVVVVISLFVFMFVVVNYVYGESNLYMFKLDNKIGCVVYIIGYLGMIYWGVQVVLFQVWVMVDMVLGLMMVINIIVIVWMIFIIVFISKDYFKKKDSGVNMEYKVGDCEIQGKLEDGIWD